MSTALLLIAHGSRRPEANADLYAIAARLRRQAKYPIVVEAFLECTEPDIAQGAARCVSQGARRVIMLPYFLSPGVHCHNDLAEARDLLAERYPFVDFVLGEPIGQHRLLTRILLERAKEAAVVSRTRKRRRVALQHCVNVMESH